MSNITPSDLNVFEQLSHSRGGNAPLTFLDLIHRQTIDFELASWLMSQVCGGASFIIGAGPGGVGKTTLMRSLLSFVPSSCPLVIALPGQISSPESSPHCFISLELSDHRPPGYLWGQDLEDFFKLSTDGHILVGNMHVDSLDQAEEEICQRNNVTKEQFLSINLFIFLRVEGEELSTRRINNTEARRYISSIYLTESGEKHQLAYSSEEGFSSNIHRNMILEQSCLQFLQKLRSNQTLTVSEIRSQFLAWEQKSKKTK